MPDVESNPEYVALFESVLAKPEDDAPRLILADWLQENGQEDRAEFIRLQVHSGSDGITIDSAFDHRSERATMFVLKHGDAWLGKWRHLVLKDHAANWVFRRGFIAEITLLSEEYVQHAKELFSTFPIESVRLPNRTPLSIVHRSDRYPAFMWMYETAAKQGEQIFSLPDPVCFWLEMIQGSVGRENFATEENAIEAASRACVAHGREIAAVNPERTETERKRLEAFRSLKAIFGR